MCLMVGLEIKLLNSIKCKFVKFFGVRFTKIHIYFTCHFLVGSLFVKFYSIFLVKIVSN